MQVFMRVREMTSVQCQRSLFELVLEYGGLSLLKKAIQPRTAPRSRVYDHAILAPRFTRVETLFARMVVRESLCPLDDTARFGSLELFLAVEAELLPHIVAQQKCHGSPLHTIDVNATFQERCHFISSGVMGNHAFSIDGLKSVFASGNIALARHCLGRYEYLLDGMDRDMFYEVLDDWEENYYLPSPFVVHHLAEERELLHPDKQVLWVLCRVLSRRVQLANCSGDGMKYLNGVEEALSRISARSVGADVCISAGRYLIGTVLPGDRSSICVLKRAVEYVLCLAELFSHSEASIYRDVRNICLKQVMVLLTCRNPVCCGLSQRLELEELWRLSCLEVLSNERFWKFLWPSTKHTVSLLQHAREMRRLRHFNQARGNRILTWAVLYGDRCDALGECDRRGGSALNTFHALFSTLNSVSWVSPIEEFVEWIPHYHSESAYRWELCAKQGFLPLPFTYVLAAPSCEADAHRALRMIKNTAGHWSGSIALARFCASTLVAPMLSGRERVCSVMQVVYGDEGIPHIVSAQLMEAMRRHPLMPGYGTEHLTWLRQQQFARCLHDDAQFAVIWERRVSAMIVAVVFLTSQLDLCSHRVQVVKDAEPPHCYRHCQGCALRYTQGGHLLNILVETFALAGKMIDSVSDVYDVLTIACQVLYDGNAELFIDVLRTAIAEHYGSMGEEGEDRLSALGTSTAFSMLLSTLNILNGLANDEDMECPGMCNADQRTQTLTSLLGRKSLDPSICKASESPGDAQGDFHTLESVSKRRRILID